jgi:uncharacterized protein (TIGR02270 family)
MLTRCCRTAHSGSRGLGRPTSPYDRANDLDSRDLELYAAWSTARLGIHDPDVLDVLRELADSASLYAEPALHMALLCLRLDEAHTWVSTMLKDPRHQRFGVEGIGIVGDPARISELIGYMQIEPLSRVAGESFSMITGADLKYLDLYRPNPETFESGPSDDSNDANVAMDQDEDLAWPAPELVRKWWDKHEHGFQTGARYMRGKPIEPAGLIDTLRTGYQRQRAAAALELALLRPSDPMFEVRAPGKRQSARLCG